MTTLIHDQLHDLASWNSFQTMQTQRALGATAAEADRLRQLLAKADKELTDQCVKVEALTALCKANNIDVPAHLDVASEGAHPD
ncbi:hypothetical protein [Methylibium petroleiphilum]